MHTFHLRVAFEDCVDLAHAPLAFLYSNFVWGLCDVGLDVDPHAKRKCDHVINFYDA